LSDDDAYQLNRFVTAQRDTYAIAVSEIRAGRKQSHWMWFIFPQIDGLGSSPTARHYAIRSKEEAEAYLRHPVLGARLVECAEAALSITGRSVREIFGAPDGLKLRSSATLFAAVAPKGSVFERVLERYFNAQADQRTLDRLLTR
jgi:uncharacterized protein (DUF1810 family)